MRICQGVFFSKGRASVYKSRLISVRRQHRGLRDQLCRDDQVLLIHYGAALAGIVFLFQMVSAGAATAAGLAPGASFRAWFKPILAVDEELTEEGRAAQRRFWLAFAKLIAAGIIFVLT